jgi:hypothetical protein
MTINIKYVTFIFMKKFIVLIISFLIISGLNQAQVTEYYFTQQNSTYNGITGGTILWSGTLANEVSGEITIPSFTYNGNAYTSLFISANGFITFGAAPDGTNYIPISSAATYYGAVSAFGCDLAHAAGGTPEVRYEQAGNEFIVQWKDVRRSAVTGEIISFQIRLNTVNNFISVIYGGTITPGLSGSNPQVGLRGPDNTFATNVNNRMILSDGGNWVNSIKGVANASSMYFNSANPGTVPTSGLTFTWKPLLNPLNFTATAINLSQIDLSWQKNSLNQNVMLAYNTSATFGTPVSGQVYSPGNAVTGGGTVLFYGDGTSFSHTSLNPNTVYYYKIWSYDAVPDYSSGVTAFASVYYSLPYLQAFSTASMPAEWTTNFSNPTYAYGIAGTYGPYERMYSSNTSAYAISPLVGSVTSETYLSFFYRITDNIGHPLNATSLGAGDKIEIQVSEDNGTTYTTIHTINNTNHTATTDFASKSLSLGAYNGDFIKVRFLCTWASGDYIIDLDHVLIEEGNNMSYAASTVEQASVANVGVGTTNNEIVRLQVLTQKSSAPISLTSISMSTSGSIDTDLAAARIFYTSTPVFSTGVQFGNTVFNPGGSFIINGNQVLAEGYNYFWVAYDIKPTATSGNYCDGGIQQLLTSESSVLKVPTAIYPPGNRKIGTILSGTKTIPANYATIAAAVTALNNGVVGSGGVTFNVAADHTESSTSAIIVTQNGTAANPVIFQKSGAGNNPLVTHTGAGTVSTSTLGQHADGVIILEGADYITFDGIDVTASQSGIEYGYYLRKASTTDGCKHVTIKNASITMNKGASRFVTGFCAANNSMGSSNIGIITPSGAHQEITFTGNTISNVFTGIWLGGYNTFFDQDYTIGTLGAGNTIQNYAGNDAATAYGIYLTNVNNATLGYNTISNAGGGGSNFTATGYGIFNAGALGNSFNALNNTIALVSQSATDPLYGIRTLVNGAVQVDYNTITLSNSASTSTGYYYISNDIITASSASHTINHNTFTGSDINSTGNVYFIFNSNSQISPSVSEIKFNTTSGNFNRTGSAGSFYLYYNNGTATGTEIIEGNSFSNITQSGASVFTGIYSNTSNGNTQQVLNNSITNITSGSGQFNVFNLRTASTRNIYGNTVTGINTEGEFFGINFGPGDATSHIYNNNFTNISTSTTSANLPVMNGILIPYGLNVYIYNNFISDLRAPASASTDAIRAISVTSSTANSLVGVYNNSIYLNASSSGENFGTTGVYHLANAVSTTAQLDLRDNIIINKSTPNGIGKTAVLRRDNSDLANFSTISDNNILYAGTPGPSRLILQDATGYQTLEDYQAYVAPRDEDSHTDDPLFINTTTAPFDLHMQPSVPALSESTGQTIVAPILVNTDHDGNSRAEAPDIGADEFEGIAAFIANPASFTAAPLSSQQNRLVFSTNSSSSDVVVVYSTEDSFNQPSGTPVTGQPLANGTVIYIGNTSPFDHNSLTTGATYYYKAFSYNGSIYSTGLPASAVPGVDPAGNFAAVSSGQTQVNLGWSKNTYGNDVIVASHNVSITGNPVNGTSYNIGDPVPSGGSIIYKGPASSFLHSGLTSWTQHYYKIWSYDLYNYYSSGSVTDEVTLSNPVTDFPYMLDFSGTWAHNPSAPPWWKVVDVDGTGDLSWVKFTSNYLSSPACVRGYEQGSADDYLISPPMILPDQDMQLTWYDKVSSESSNNSYKVLLSTTNNQVSSFTVELGDYNCTNTSWTIRTISLNVYQGQTVFIAFRHYYSQSEYETFTIDNITVGSSGTPSTIWTGTISASWTNAANWSNGVPGPTHEAIIYTGSFPPILTMPATIYKLNVMTGAVINISTGGSLNITGGE